MSSLPPLLGTQASKQDATSVTAVNTVNSRLAPQLRSLIRIGCNREVNLLAGHCIGRLHATRTCTTYLELPLMAMPQANESPRRKGSLPMTFSCSWIRNFPPSLVTTTYRLFSRSPI